MRQQVCRFRFRLKIRVLLDQDLNHKIRLYKALRSLFVSHNKNHKESSLLRGSWAGSTRSGTRRQSLSVIRSPWSVCFNTSSGLQLAAMLLQTTPRGQKTTINAGNSKHEATTSVTSGPPVMRFLRVAFFSLAQNGPGVFQSGCAITGDRSRGLCPP